MTRAENLGLRFNKMGKGLGIAALVFAIIALFVPLIGTWMTLLVALLAAFAYGPGFGFGIASLVINLMHIIFFSPLLWAGQGLAEIGADASGESVVFLPWLFFGAQAIAFVILVSLNARFGKQPSLNLGSERT